MLTPHPMAEDVFRSSSLPTYGNAARRVMGPAVFDALAPRWRKPRGVGTVYNRGGSLTGDSRREMQVIVRSARRATTAAWPTSTGPCAGCGRPRRGGQAVRPLRRGSPDGGVRLTV